MCAICFAKVHIILTIVPLAGPKETFNVRNEHISATTPDIKVSALKLV